MIEMEKCAEACKFSNADAALKDKLERHKNRVLVLECRAQIYEGASAAKNIALLKQKNLTANEKAWLSEIENAAETEGFLKALKEATDDRDAHALELVIKRIQKAGLQNRLHAELDKAEKDLKRFKLEEKVKKQVREMKPPLIAELMSFRDPPSPVKTTVKAVFRLLGHDLKELSWEQCQILMKQSGKMSLKYRIQNFDASLKSVDPTHVADAKKLIGQMDVDELMNMSQCAAVFGLWCRTMVDPEHSSRTSITGAPNKEAKKASSKVAPSIIRSKK
jgi:hypothetical protein